MPVGNQNDYRDKTADCMDFFLRARARDLAPLVDAALLAEHATDPRGGDGRHGAALQDVLNQGEGDVPRGMADQRAGRQEEQADRQEEHDFP